MERKIVEDNGVLFIALEPLEKGGAGSGNFGHGGRAGVRGGSAGGGGRVAGGGGGRAYSENGGVYSYKVTEQEAKQLDGYGFYANNAGQPTFRSEDGKGVVSISPTPEGGWELSGKDAYGDPVEPENYDLLLEAADDAMILAEEGAEAFDYMLEDFNNAMPSGEAKKYHAVKRNGKLIYKVYKGKKE